MPQMERYEQLVNEVYKELIEISDVEVRSIYAAIKKDPWIPERETYDIDGKLIDKAVDSEWIEWVLHQGRGEDGLVVNENHPRLKPVFQAIKELEDCLDKELGPDIFEELEKENKCLIDIHNRQYWEDILYRRPLLD